MSTYKRTLSILLSLMMAFSMLVLPAFAGEEGKHTLTINYVYAQEEESEGDPIQAYDSYTNEFAKGDTYSIESPKIEGYTPYKATVEGEMGTEDITETVTYTKTPDDDEEQDSDWQYLESMPDDFPKEEFKEQDKEYKEEIMLYRLNDRELTPTAPEKDIKDLYGDYDSLYNAIIEGKIEVFKKGVKYKKLDQEISASDITVRIGETKAIGASAKTDLTYGESEDESLAIIDDKGNIEAKGAGTTQVTIKAGDDKYYNAAEKTITVTVLNKENQTIKTPNNTYSKRFGQPAFSLGVSAKTKLTYKVTSGSSVAAVDSKGKVSIRGTGTAKVTITASETDLYNATQKTVTVKVNPPAAPSLTAKAIGNRKVQLNWSAVPGAVKYQIQPYIDNKSLTAKTVSGRTIKNTGLKRGRQYKYKVRAIVTVNKKTIYSPWSVLRAVRVK